MCGGAVQKRPIPKTVHMQTEQQWNGFRSVLKKILFFCGKKSTFRFVLRFNLKKAAFNYSYMFEAAKPERGSTFQ